MQRPTIKIGKESSKQVLPTKINSLRKYSTLKHNDLTAELQEVAIKIAEKSNKQPYAIKTVLMLCVHGMCHTRQKTAKDALAARLDALLLRLVFSIN